MLDSHQPDRRWGRFSDYRPLAELLPDPDLFAADPAEALRQAPIAIGPFRPVVMSAVLALLCGIVWVVPEFHTWVTIVRISVVLAVPFVVYAWLSPPPIILDATGIEVRRG